VFKRVTWFATGAAAGLGGAVYARRRVREAVGRLAPEHVQQAARDRARAAAERVADAVREGRAAMREREQELRDNRPGHTTVIDTTGRASGRPGAEPNSIQARQAAR
jgi:hypothetical protein